MEPISLALRFALYLDLGLLFGMPFFALYSFKKNELAEGFAKHLTSVSLVFACSGVVLSLFSLIDTAKNMSGVSSWAEVNTDTLGMLLYGTAFGAAWIVRVAALCVAALLAWLRPRGQPGIALLCLVACIALLTVAWSGHAVMDDGLRRYLHLSSDFAHLLAAATWLGALVSFVMQIEAKNLASPSEIERLKRTVSGFAPIGAMIVSVLLVSGAINYLFIVGVKWPNHLYGELLLVKLFLFSLMLLLAAANRFRLGPLLENASWGEVSITTISHLRKSLRMEASIAFLVLAVVSSLGVQSPFGS
ncbi:copper homeostasis membrane protein CopD [Limnobacter litoralis]|uniref:Copper resistance protein CopD n=1 Tax=Limnobacter litoralis TaxID=481366 RepID=A0ABQ5YMM6_9BURK|nr:copper homeostasis membrane protein CopD [Limnobacter litoralis]GLR25186.1 copper resistance protein CopD [Limnobacter litoralis]